MNPNCLVASCFVFINLHLLPPSPDSTPATVIKGTHLENVKDDTASIQEKRGSDSRYSTRIGRASAARFERTKGSRSKRICPEWLNSYMEGTLLPYEKRSSALNAKYLLEDIEKGKVEGDELIKKLKDVASIGSADEVRLLVDTWVHLSKANTLRKEF